MRARSRWPAASLRPSASQHVKRTPSMARLPVRPGRPRKASTCCGMRTAHVESAQRGRVARAATAGGGEMVYVCAHLLGRKKEWCWPVPIDGPDARPGPESILGHGARRSRSVASMAHDRRAGPSTGWWHTFNRPGRRRQVVSHTLRDVMMVGEQGADDLTACRARAVHVYTCGRHVDVPGSTDALVGERHRGAGALRAGQPTAQSHTSYMRPCDCKVAGLRGARLRRRRRSPVCYIAI